MIAWPEQAASIQFIDDIHSRLISYTAFAADSAQWNQCHQSKCQTVSGALPFDPISLCPIIFNRIYHA
jgi:hypothetical protein